MKNFKNLTKRSLSLLLALIMCMSLLNLTVFAAEDEPVLICNTEEHTHGEECYSDVLTCGQDESEGHAHGDDCYGTVRGDLLCTLEESEGHTHGDGCYELTCTVEESEEHTHGDGCYELTCTVDESEGHTHVDACYEPVQTLTCTVEESEGHTHDNGCYELQLTCELEEHTHSDKCYEDLEIAPLNEGKDENPNPENEDEGTDPEDEDENENTPTCTCTAKCTEENVNATCPVCSAEGADLDTCCNPEESGETEKPTLDLVQYLTAQKQRENPNWDPETDPVIEGSLWTTGDEPEQVLPDPTTGEATIEQNTLYLLKLSFNAPYGFVPGTYRYQSVPSL